LYQFNEVFWHFDYCFHDRFWAEALSGVSLGYTLKKFIVDNK
jgi:hypothetical protein